MFEDDELVESGNYANVVVISEFRRVFLPPGWKL
jgi:hypothetical protein